jgi:hypothetical protein
LDPNGAHAIAFGKLCGCGAELCHPDEIKAGRCYPCLSKEKKQIDPWDFPACPRTEVATLLFSVALIVLILAT